MPCGLGFRPTTRPFASCPSKYIFIEHDVLIKHIKNSNVLMEHLHKILKGKEEENDGRTTLLVKTLIQLFRLRNHSLSFRPFGTVDQFHLSTESLESLTKVCFSEPSVHGTDRKDSRFLHNCCNKELGHKNTVRGKSDLLLQL
jgi:hypothetical protein